MSNQLVVITGVASVDRRLKSLIPRLQKKVIRKAMRDGLKVIKQETKAQSPIETGETKRNVSVRALKKRKRNLIAMEVRIKAVDSLKRTTKSGEVYFYPALVEYEPDPFMKRAYDTKGRSARNETMKQIHLGIDREASKP